MKSDKQDHDIGQILEDVGQLASAVFGTLLGGRSMLRDQAKQKFTLASARLPFVTREDYDALHAMLQQARMEQSRLAARLDALEGKTVHSKKTAPANDDRPVKKKLTRQTRRAKKSSPSRNKSRPA